MNLNTIINLVGGLAIFIYGVNLVSEAAKLLAGNKIRSIMSVVIKHRWAGLIVGIVITFLLQSSSASTVLFVSLVQGGLIAFCDTIAMILGAMIGTTLTVQIIAFNVSDYSLIMVFIGVIILISSKYKRNRIYANLFIGLGLIFFGMAVMKLAVAPLRQSPAFVEWFQNTLGSPWLSFIIAAIFTALVQASAATMALIFTFSTAGLLGDNAPDIIRSALPFVFGANVGTTVTALLAAIGSSRAAIRCAFAHTAIKMFGALICMFFISPMANLTLFFSQNSSPERMLAYSHTIFNVLNVIVLFPFTAQISRFFIFIIPDNKAQVFFPYLNNINIEEFDQKAEFNNSYRALNQCISKVQRTIASVNLQFVKPSWNALEDISVKDRRLNDALDEIELHAKTVFQLAEDKVNRAEISNVIRIAELVERLGDDYAKGICHTIKKLLKENLRLSDDEINLLQDLNLRIIQLLDDVTKAYKNAEKVKFRTTDIYIELKTDIIKARDHHINKIERTKPNDLLHYNCYSDILSEIESALTKIKKFSY